MLVDAYNAKKNASIIYLGLLVDRSIPLIFSV